MNLVAYDKVTKFVPGKDYIQCNYKRLLSSTIDYYDKYCLLKRFEDDNKYNYYVAVFDNAQPNIKHKYLKRDNNGYVKVYLTDIWNELPSYITNDNCNINVELVETQDDGKVYKLIF